jgi:UDP-N-acetylmuramyl pentapeptide phosphotransferase/UDP-N-acetylglucosamine-1-phosphate transferase
MSAVIAFFVGAVVAASLWRAMAPQFHESDVLRRENYRGHALPVASGVVVVLAVVFVGAVASIMIKFGGESDRELSNVEGLVRFAWATVGFGFIGLLDDLVGATSTKGFRGHLGALASGRVSTGLVKLVWGVLLGVLASPGDGWSAVRGGVLIAACANLGNLFDRAPGRTVKVSLLGGAAVVALGAPAVQLSGMMVVLGAGLGMLVPDLRERCMLGDTGSNVLGAAVGFGLVVAAGSTGEWVALAAVVALNIASEFVSFTKVIDATAPLRFFDRVGALPERRTQRAE